MKQWQKGNIAHDLLLYGGWVVSHGRGLAAAFGSGLRMKDVQGPVNRDDKAVRYQSFQTSVLINSATSTALTEAELLLL